MQTQLEEMNEQGYKWSGIKLSTKFKDGQGHYVLEALFPEDYLATVQWKQPERMDEPDPQPFSEIGNTIKASEFDILELEAAIAASKTNKAPGPDLVQAELLKYLDSAKFLLCLAPLLILYMIYFSLYFWLEAKRCICSRCPPHLFGWLFVLWFRFRFMWLSAVWALCSSVVTTQHQLFVVWLRGPLKTRTCHGGLGHHQARLLAA